MALRCPAVDLCASAKAVQMARRREVSAPSSGISVVGEEFRKFLVDIVLREARVAPLATLPGMLVRVYWVVVRGRRLACQETPTVLVCCLFAGAGRIGAVRA